MAKLNTKKNNKGKVNVGVVILVIIILVLIVLAILFFLLPGFGFGFGKGNGTGVFSSNSESEGDGSQNVTESITETVSTAEVTTEATTEVGNSNEVTIKIQEDKVWVNDKQISDKDELKSYIEEINNDDKKYTLEQENAILATYNWVVGVLDELKIEYTELKTETIVD